MRTPLYKQYENTKPIGVYCMSNWGGLEVLDVTEKNGEQALVACYNWGTGRQHIARHIIRYTTTDRAYIRKGNFRFYLDEIMRI